MKNLRRYFKKGHLYFLTHVTNNREKILINNFDLLWCSISKYKKESQYNLIAWVVLPEHMHFILDPIDNDISKLMKKIKLSFSMNYLKSQNLRSGRIWQNRFWDHQIRNENDLNKHIDYIHFNPVKHNHVSTPKNWRYSSFKQYLERGVYPNDWGRKKTIEIEGDFGE